MSNDNAFQYDGSEIIAPMTAFNSVNPEAMEKLILQSTPKYCELDPIPSPLIKACAKEFSPIISRIVNLSVQNGYVPPIYKTAIVRPLHKKPSLPHTISNYRPVSNLPYISKIIEKVVGLQMVEHSALNNLTEKFQSAYKRDHSTETAMIRIFNDLLTNLDNNQAILVTLLDLSAAFDTVDHTILLERLHKTHGIDSTALEWFRSYLSNRSYRVCVDGQYSEIQELERSVPQGSQLGPRLYSDYTQPIGRLIRFLELLFHGYADDTSLMKPIPMTSDLSSATDNMASCVASVSEWMTQNKLKLNPEKKNGIFSDR